MTNAFLMNDWYWFGLAALLIIVEVTFGASFFLLWLGITASIVGIVAWILPNLQGEYQLLIFAVGSVMSIVFWRLYLKRHPIKTDRPTLNRRAEQYVGRTFTLSEPIVNGRGKIRVDDSSWRVEGQDLPAGSTVLVVGVDGIILKVKEKRDNS